MVALACRGTPSVVVGVTGHTEREPALLDGRHADADGPPQAIIDASDKSSPADTIKRRLSTCVMWKILGRQAARSQNEIRVRALQLLPVPGRAPTRVDIALP